MILPPHLPRDAIQDAFEFVDELQRRDFTSFVIGAYPKLRGGADLLPNWHLDAIAHHLNEVRAGTSLRSLVTLPPRNLKSIMISVAWPAWCLGHDPALNFVCVSYAQELSAKHARDCRALMQSSWYQRLFPRTELVASRTAVHDFETTRGGGRLATSVGGTLTGRGGDIIIIDDPINPTEVNSDKRRDSVNDWFASTLSSRLNDKTRGAIVLVMQRLHEYDLAGILIEAGGWKHLNLPAIAQVDAEVPLTRGRTHYRRTGDVLHPAHEPLSALMNTKHLQGSIYFNAQYLQDPLPAQGNLIKAIWFKVYDPAEPLPHGVIVQSWDTATEAGALNDWSVCITAHVSGSIVRILDVTRQKLIFPDLKRKVIALAQSYRVQTLLIEKEASGRQLIQQLHGEEPPNMPLPIPVRPEGDKTSRVMGVSGQIEAGQVYLPPDAPWLALFKAELLAFPSGGNDDQVDALTQLMNWVLRRRPPENLAGPELIIEGDETDYSWIPQDIKDDPWS